MSVPEAILLKIDHVLSLKDRKELKDAIEDVIPELEAFSPKRKEPEVNYLLGYCWYLHPDRQYSKQIEGEVEKALTLAIKQDSNHAKAWLYLGHNAYDFAHYRLALERFMNVDPYQLPPYLKLKTQEMLICCKIRLEGLGLCLLDMEQFAVSAEKYQPEDLWPQELAKTITESRDYLSEFERGRFKKIAQRIDATGKLGNWFSELFERFTGQSSA